jgi:hypothetical protein
MKSIAESDFVTNVFSIGWREKPTSLAPSSSLLDIVNIVNDFGSNVTMLVFSDFRGPSEAKLGYRPLRCPH